MRALALVFFGATTALAQQPPDPVVLYGRVFGLVESIHGDAPGASRTRVTNQSSMLGLRGSERVAADLAAWFQLETAFPLDGASSPFANRNSAVGLKGSWGVLLAGRWDSAFEQTQAGIVDPFMDQGLPDITAAALHQGNFARRQQNALQFWTPQWHGLQAKLSYAAGETRGAANPHDYGASIAYADPRSYLALAFEKHVDQTGALVEAGHHETGYGMAAFRRFGAMKIDGQLGSYARTGAEPQRSYSLGFEWSPRSLPRATLLGIYQRVWHGRLLRLSAGTVCSVQGLGIRYALSPRTFLVAEAARVDNRQGNLCNFGSNAIEIAAGQGLRGVGAGLRTVF